MKARGAVVATLFCVMLMSALYPLRQYASQDSHVDALIKQEHALERKIGSLKRQQALLLSDQEIERVAREELGMVRPGEVAFAVMPGERSAAPKSAPAIRLPTADVSPPWYDRWWGVMLDSIRGMR